jgi:phage portal protein BeeE
MRLRSFLRGDDILSSSTKTETRSLPAPENELPLLAAYTASPVTPTAAVAIADVWAAVRVLADAAAYGRLYVSPVELRSFEADGGLTNKQNVRMETNAGYAVERLPAALRIL